MGVLLSICFKRDNNYVKIEKNICLNIKVIGPPNSGKTTFI